MLLVGGCRARQRAKSVYQASVGWTRVQRVSFAQSSSLLVFSSSRFSFVDGSIDSTYFVCALFNSRLLSPLTTINNVIFLIFISMRDKLGKISTGLIFNFGYFISAVCAHFISHFIACSLNIHYTLTFRQIILSLFFFCSVSAANIFVASSISFNCWSASYFVVFSSLFDARLTNVKRRVTYFDKASNDSINKIENRISISFIIYCFDIDESSVGQKCDLVDLRLFDLLAR